jgi:hypothetical protein
VQAAASEARVFRPLPEDASIEQLIHAYQEQAAAYATVAFALSHRLPSIEQKLDELGQGLVGDRAERKELERDLAELTTDLRHLTGRVRALEDAAAALRAQTALPPLPPMRAESPSSHDLAKHVSKDVMRAVKEYESNPTTPPGPPPSEELERIIEERTVARLAIRDAARLQKIDDDRREAEKADAAVSRQLRLQRGLTILAVIAGVISTLVARFAR